MNGSRKGGAAPAETPARRLAARLRAGARGAGRRLRDAWRDRHGRRWLAGAALLALASCGAGGVAAAWTRACAAGCPTAEQIADFAPRQATLVLDASGDTLAEFYRERRTVVPLDALPAHVPMAFVAVEDQRFFAHEGVDPIRMVGAVRDNLVGGFGASGGSTITMQLARNLFPQQIPAGEKTIRRKLAEVRLALEMERRFSKERLLEMYLNTIYLGAGAYGIEAAARTYFGRPAAELTPLQAATLAALPKAPSFYDPRRNPDAARRRRDLVLGMMARAGVIEPAEAAALRRRPLGLAPPGGARRAPYFVEQVRAELEPIFGELLYTGGLRVHTTLDPELQAAADSALEAQLQAVEAGRYGRYRHLTYAEYVDSLGSRTPTSTPYLQGTVVVMDPATGAVRALVGGRDWEHSQFNRATQAVRQPGSSFKPFVYAAALEHGLSPGHAVSDERIAIRMGDGSTWTPRNYDGTYEGWMTMREGLRRSRNMVAIRVGREVGVEAVRDVARRTGVESEIPAYPSVFIGSAGVRPIEMVAAYAAFANGGWRVEPRFVTAVEDGAGRPLWEPAPRVERALDPAVAWILTDMLREVVDRGTGAGARSSGLLPWQIPAAGKTGTTNDATDVWFVGYTPDLVAGVWIGLDQPQRILRGATGGSLAVPVWARTVAAAYRDREPPDAWRRPPGVVSLRVRDGRPVSRDCLWGSDGTDLFAAAHAPDPVCEPPRWLRDWFDPNPELPGRPVRPGERGVPRPEEYVRPGGENP